MNKRFVGPIGAEHIALKRTPPTAAQIAAIGRALPKGAHKLTDDQQKAWFGYPVFDAPVEWKDGAFVSEGKRINPAKIGRGGR